MAPPSATYSSPPIHSSALGALLAVSNRLWYPEYSRQAAAWKVDGLADQQLAGLLMWVPAGVIFIVFGLALLAAWLGEAERRVRFGATDAAARRLLLVLVAILTRRRLPMAYAKRK